MHKKIIFTALIVILLAFSKTVFAETPAESLKKNYPDLQFDSIKEIQIKGLYEVISGINIFYYHPKTGYIISGEIHTKDGKNLTSDRNTEIVSAKAKNLPLDKAIKIGSGKNIVVEFTDPDCPYCRKASEYFKKRDDITRYIFFFPIVSLHPQAEDKAKYILCAKDKTKAYEEVMNGELDGKKVDVCDDKEVITRLEEHKQLGASIGVQGTPSFVISRQFIRGANFQKIESLLKK